MPSTNSCFPVFFFNDTATTEIYTLSLHDALPILQVRSTHRRDRSRASSSPPHGFEHGPLLGCLADVALEHLRPRSEEHTSELQSHSDLVCRLLLEKKK